MEPERWQQISRIYHAAQDRPHPERAAFVRDTCAGDASLRREVESLLAYEGAAVQFLEHPPAGADRMPPDAPDAVAAIPMGTGFGSYEVVARLGAGGMGEVYRAHDRKLGRDVAIKILPRQFATDADRRARLEREARLLATLNHPHIGGIYGLEDREGVLALVLEMVEGDTLAERIARGRPDKPAIKVREALSIARQITDALEAAHDKGIVHRDLKPANIKVTPTGTVKVLDFGIAKASGGDASGGHQGPLPAMGVAGTGLGAVIGTPAYMSPEQALGQKIDKRTDIWAFGCVLYEMLTGRGVFGGDTPSETTAAIFDRVPDWHALPDATPSGIRRLLQRCLDRDPNRRVHDIADARLEIDDALASPAGETVAVRAAPFPRVIPVAMAALAGGAVVALVAWANTRPSPRAPETPTRFAISLAPSERPNLFDSGRALAISPDGRHLVRDAGRADVQRAQATVDKAQYLVCVVLVVVGAFLIYDAVTLEAGFAKVDPVGPKMFPIVIGVVLILLAIVLAVAIPRGSVGEADAGEDVDPNMPSDWRTVGMLVGVFVATILLVKPLGWAITGALLFAGAATILGSRHYVRNIAIGAVLSVGSFYAFYSGLGIPLPAGILDGIL